MTPSDDRIAPVAPPDELWDAAAADYAAGRVIKLEIRNTHAAAEVLVTLTWLTQWRTLALSVSQRRAIRTAASQIHRDAVHPCLGKRQIPGRDGCYMAAPYPGVTLTWQALWNDPSVPVLLTLDADPDGY